MNSKTIKPPLSKPFLPTTHRYAYKKSFIAYLISSGLASFYNYAFSRFELTTNYIRESNSQISNHIRALYQVEKHIKQGNYEQAYRLLSTLEGEAYVLNKKCIDMLRSQYTYNSIATLVEEYCQTYLKE
jgi:hypothetical protein